MLTVKMTEREVILRRAATPGEFEAFVEGLRSDPAGQWEDHEVVAMLVDTTHVVARRYPRGAWSLLSNDDPAWASGAPPVYWPLPDDFLVALSEVGEVRLRPEVHAA